MLSASSLHHRFEPLSFKQLDGWQKDDHLAAFNCFKVSAKRMIETPYKTKSLGVSTLDLIAISQKAINHTVQTPTEAKTFFEENFCPYQYGDSSKAGLLTGYFEPEVSASRVKTAQYKYPIYRKPDDLIELDDTNRPAAIHHDFAFGRQTAKGIVEYFDRGEIQNGALEGLNLELFWLEDPVDLYYIHIQGSACLRFENGSFTRVSYAAKSGHPYTSVGSILVRLGEMKLEEVTMQSIKIWLNQNSSRQNEIFNGNRSFIFFQTFNQPNINSGPIGAAGVSLTSARSMAVDHNLYSFGLPIWVETKDKFIDSNHRFKKLLIAQDTGSAIVGVQRGDYFVGSGKKAGMIAGQIKHRASMKVFVPNPGQGRQIV